MKRTALMTAALCAISSGTFAQSTRSVIIIPAFENRFAGIHQQPLVALHTINRSPGLEVRSFGASTDPAARGVVTSPTAAARGRLDPTVMNIPVFPGNTVLLQQQGGFGFGGGPFAVPAANAGFGSTGFFIEQGGGSSLQRVDPFRTTAAPGPAVNAVPTPAAPVPTTPQLQPTTGTTIPVHQQNPTTLVPGQAIPVTPNPGTPNQGQPIGSGQGTSTQSQPSGSAQENR